MPQADLAWLLAAFALVALMFPGLALYYGGLLGTNNVLNMFMMVLSTLAVTAVLYVLYGYGMVSGNSVAGLGLVGNPLEFFGMNGFETDDGSGGPQSIYWAAFFVLFAAITIAIVASGAAGRMKFGAWIVFSALWLTLVYFPIAHWVFTYSDDETGYVGGWLRNVVHLHDYAGGTAVHMTAGVGALALALVLGKSKTPLAKPHNLPLVILGAGVLWFGWFGFNGGSAAGANFLAQYVVMTTLLAGWTAHDAGPRHRRHSRPGRHHPLGRRREPPRGTRRRTGIRRGRMLGHHMEEEVGRRRHPRRLRSPRNRRNRRHAVRGADRRRICACRRDRRASRRRLEHPLAGVDGHRRYLSLHVHRDLRHRLDHEQGDEHPGG
jgi:Ammonium Transporter Family